MAASQKAIDNATRLRYIRALQRFHKSIMSYLLNTPEITTKTFFKKIDNGVKLLNRVEEIALYKGELQDLQTFVKKIINYKNSQKDIEDIKSEILYGSNQLEKSQNAKKYKKNKHSKSQYDDGY